MAHIWSVKRAYVTSIDGDRYLVLRCRPRKRGGSSKPLEYAIELQPDEFLSMQQPGGRFAHWRTVPFKYEVQRPRGPGQDNQIAWIVERGCGWSIKVCYDEPHMAVYFTFDDPLTAIEFKLLFS